MQYCCYMTFPKSVCILTWNSFYINYTKYDMLTCFGHKRSNWLHITTWGFIVPFFVRFAASLSLLSLTVLAISSCASLWIYLWVV